MPDTEKTPEQIQAEKDEATRLQAERDERDRHLATAVATSVVDGLTKAEDARLEAARKAAATEDPPVEGVDPAEFDKAIAEGKPIAPLIAKFGAGVAEQTRRELKANTEVDREANLYKARAEIEHFKDYEADILTIVARVSPAKRNFGTYQQAAAMVLGRPDIQKKIVDERVAAEVAKVTSKPKESAGVADLGGAARIVRPSGDAKDGKLLPTEDNLRTLVGEDAYLSFIEMKRARGWTLDSFAQKQGYADASAWFTRMQENDERSLRGEGLGLDR